MRALVIGEAEREAIRRVVDHAERFPTDLRVMRLIAAGHLAPPTHVDPGFATEIPIGWRVAFTIEEHPPGWCRHISVSIDSAYPAGPNQLGVQAIMTEFGMDGAIEDCEVYLEEGDQLAINVLQLIRGTLPPACRVTEMMPGPGRE